MRISKRAINIPSSPIRKLVKYADQAKKNGIHVYHLNIGQPDIETPEAIWNAIKNYNVKVLEYGPSQGFVSLRNAIKNYFKFYNIDISVENICITTGGSEAIMFALNTVCDPGDEVLIFEPFYANYLGYAAMSEIKLTPITLKAENGFHINNFDEIEKKINKKTKAILFSNPSNPTGTVFTKKEILEIFNLAKKYDLYIISDEVYKEFIYTNENHFSALELPEPERVILIDSISKRFSACGARIGAIITKNSEIMENILKMAMARLCPPTLEQIGAEAAYNLPHSYFEPIVKEYKKRRDITYEILSKIDGIKIHKPEGAFYCIVKIPVDNSEKFAKWMLTDFNVNKKTTMISPANGFYISPDIGYDEIRIAYILKERDLIEALEILAEGIKTYKRIKIKN